MPAQYDDPSPGSYPTPVPLHNYTQKSALLVFQAPCIKFSTSTTAIVMTCFQVVVNSPLSTPAISTSATPFPMATSSETSRQQAPPQQVSRRRAYPQLSYFHHLPRLIKPINRGMTSRKSRSRLEQPRPFHQSSQASSCDGFGN